MKRKSGYVNRVELLITLDYLFKYTDETHPATCPLICKYATKYGVIYDPNKKEGNEINRHRISDTFNFLYEFSNNHKGIIPFEIKMTDGGKYYVSNRNNLTTEQVIEILESINSYKFISDDTKIELTDKVKAAFLNERDICRIALSNQQTVSYRKFSNDYYTKLRLLKKAAEENKLVRLRTIQALTTRTRKIIKEDYYRVYKLKESRNKMCAILISVHGSCLSSPVEEIELVNTTLIEEFEEKNDINMRFNNSHYASIEELLEDNKILAGKNNIASNCIFIFRKSCLDIIKRSFEEYFSYQFQYKEKTVKQIKEKYSKANLDEYRNENEVICYCKIRLNCRAFMFWVINDYYVANRITIIYPQRINTHLARAFTKLNDKYTKYMEEKR